MEAKSMIIGLVIGLLVAGVAGVIGIQHVNHELGISLGTDVQVGKLLFSNHTELTSLRKNYSTLNNSYTSLNFKAETGNFSLASAILDTYITQHCTGTTYNFTKTSNVTCDISGLATVICGNFSEATLPDGTATSFGALCTVNDSSVAVGIRINASLEKPVLPAYDPSMNTCPPDNASNISTYGLYRIGNYSYICQYNETAGYFEPDMVFHFCAPGYIHNIEANGTAVFNGTYEECIKNVSS